MASNSSLPLPPAKVSLLDAGERLFSRRGIEGTSVREIIKEAGVNLGAINYYFGTKDQLAVEVFARRLDSVNRKRVARLDALEAAAGKRRPKLTEIIDALVRPAMESDGERDDFTRLMSRCFMEPNPELKRYIEQEFAEVARRFDAALLRAVPGLPPEEIFWRMGFLFGALHHGQQQWVGFHQLPQPSGLPAVRPDREGFMQRLIAFVAAGFAAPVPKSSRVKKS